MKKTNIAFYTSGLLLKMPFKGYLVCQNDPDVIFMRLIFSENPSIAYFTQLVGGANIINMLPQPFSTFADLGVQLLDMRYNQETKKTDRFVLEIGTSPENKWQILPGLQVRDIGLTYTINNPGSRDSRASYLIQGSFCIGKDNQNKLLVTATLPNFKASASLVEGTILTGDLFAMFWKEVSLNLKSEVSSFFLDIDPTNKNYNLSCGIKSDWTFLSLGSNVDFTMTGLTLDISGQQGATSGKISGLFHIGEKTADGIKEMDINLVAGYASKKWFIEGSTGKDQNIPLVDIAYTFLKPFGIGDIPQWVSNPNSAVLDIKNISFKVVLPDDSTAENTSYNVKGEVNWQLDYSGFNLSLDALVDITYSNKEASGKITSIIELLGLNFEIGYLFEKKASDLYLQWEGIRAEYKSKEQLYILKVNEMTLGDIISKLIASISPGFKLPAPWNVLDKVNLKNFELSVDKKNGKITVTYIINLNLEFIQISKINLTREKEGVFLGFEGSFFGVNIEAGDDRTKYLAGKGCNVQELPDVPGKGKMFDLDLLVMGQHVVPAGSSSFKSVDATIQYLGEAFTDPNDTPNKIPIGKSGNNKMIFRPDSNWLIGADFTVAEFYRLALIFNDPDLYGLTIAVGGKAKFLNNLQFSILYKKISDTVGVYQTDLQLPDIFRHLEFGSVSVTLPNIGIQIYTNGDFYLDFGWPVSLTDFSRSFAFQIFPFVGSGGFYFASLSGATASNLPAVSKGTFAPVIEAGIALSLGVGKSINGGIFKAELSLSAVGMIEGTYAVFTPAKGLKYSDQTDVYYYFSGTLALVGKISCEINFVIISASLEAVAYVMASVVIESYKAIPLYFEAGISVKLSVKINLGFFKIKVSLSFSTKISASFILGSDSLQESLWYKVDHEGNMNEANYLLLSEAEEPTRLKWQPVHVSQEELLNLYLYFIPHLTVSDESTIVQNNIITTQYPQYVGMLYLDNGAGKDGMKTLLTGCLYWAIGAVLGAEEESLSLSWLKKKDVSEKAIALLIDYLEQESSLSPFNYGTDLHDFMKNFFRLHIFAADASSQNEISASVFPVIPDLIMTKELNGNKEIVDFSEESHIIDQYYIRKIHELFDSLKMSSENAAVKRFYDSIRSSRFTNKRCEADNKETFATFVFVDFITLIIKQVLYKASDCLKDENLHSINVEELVNKVVTASCVQEIGGMASRFLLHGLRLPVPSGNSPEDTAPLYVLTGQQWTIPLKQDKDQYKYTVSLERKNEEDKDWIYIEEDKGILTISIDDKLNERNERLATTVFEPSVRDGYPRAITNMMVIPQSFSLGTNTTWDYQGNLFESNDNAVPSIWKIPAAFSAALQNNRGKNISFNLQTITKMGSSIVQGSIDKLMCATQASVKIQKRTVSGMESSLSANIYELIGVNDSATHILESLLSYIKSQGNASAIEQIRILMQPDPLSGQSGFVSSVDGRFKMAIIKANMSTETNPEVNTLKAMDFICNTLNTPEEFITYLWECSVVRSGGFYLYYETLDDKKGLPEYLFDKDGTASVQLLVTYNCFIPETFLNGVVTGDDLDFSETTVYARSPEITMAVPVISQGCVGYELSRNIPDDYNPTGESPEQEKQEDVVYLQNQFNLLGTKLPDFEEYQNYMPAGPIEPNEENQKKDVNVSTTAWEYSSVIPYYKIRKAEKDNSAPEYPNLYSGIGESVMMELYWQDMFGNVLTDKKQEVSMQLLYTDTIIGVSQWPSVSSSYLFGERDGDICLYLDLCFDISRYSDGSESAKNNAATDLGIYTNLRNQLFTNDMSIKIISTIEGDKNKQEGFERDIVIADLLDYFIEPVKNYLKDVLSGEAAKPTFKYRVCAKVCKERIACYADTIPLCVCIVMERHKNVDPNFADTPGVACISTVVQPFLEEDNGVLSLTSFAQKFETVFMEKVEEDKMILIKIATSSENLGEGKDIWMVRFDDNGQKGLKYVFNQSNPSFFSPRPLATSLLSFSVPLNPYKTGQVYPAGNARKKSFSSVDMDVWGKQFLEAMDTFLSPDFAVPAFLLDNGKTLSEIIAIKEQIADAIAGTVDYIITSKDISLSCYMNAYEKWRQEILKELSAAYKYTAVVQIPVDVSSSWNLSNTEQKQKTNMTPKLYGKMFRNKNDKGETKTDTRKEYNLSTSKLPLGDGKSWLTYVFECKNVSDFRNFKFDDMRFEVSHLEQDIKEVGIGKYTSSRWLSFILPLDKKYTETGSVTIPVPLRAFPVAPTVISQNVNYETSENLQDALLWNFDFTYKNAVAAQDTIGLQLVLNTPGDKKIVRTRNNMPDLKQALAQFIESYSQINEDFKRYLVLGTENTKEEARMAVDAFKAIAGEIAQAWAFWNQVDANSLGKVMEKNNAEIPIILKYKVIESEDATGNLNIEIIADADNCLDLIPEIRIPEHEIREKAETATNLRTFEYVNIETGEPLSYGMRNDDVSRVVYVNKLNILDIQNAWGGVRLVRNEELLPDAQGTWQKTNEYFLYQTPIVMFYAKQIPLLCNDKIIDIAKIAKDTLGYSNISSLEKHFDILFSSLCKGMELLSEISVKLSVDYSYLVPDTDYQVTVPILLTFPIDLNVQECGHSLGILLAEKLRQKLLESGLPDGLFHIELNVYSLLDANVSILKLPFVLEYIHAK